MKGLLLKFALFLALFTVAYSSYSQDSTSVGKDTTLSIFRPRLGVGFGAFSFIGEVNSNNGGGSGLVVPLAYSIHASSPITNYFRLELFAQFGKLQVNQIEMGNNNNFSSRIGMGGIMLHYNLFPLFSYDNNHGFNPYIGVGFGGFEFLSKTDMYDASGSQYHYWSDGTIRSLAETDPLAGTATELYRDYTYETDLRELDLDGLGKYQEYALMFPVTVGFEWHFAKRFDFRIASTFFFTTTDLIDNVSYQGTGSRQGDKMTDMMVYTNIGLSYDMVLIKKKEVHEDWDRSNGQDFIVYDSTDTDLDGVFDVLDKCAYTSPLARVYPDGCPYDTDSDGIPDFRDDEVYSPSPEPVDAKGIYLPEDELQLLTKIFMDSTGEYVQKEEVWEVIYPGNMTFPEEKVKEDKPERNYVVVVGSEKIGVNEDDLSRYLVYDDFEMIKKGDTVYYVLGQYEKFQDAVERKMELNALGEDVEVIAETESKEDEVVYIPEVRIQKMEEHLTPVDVDDGRREKVLFRVQVGAYRNKPDPENFEDLPDVVIIKGADGLYRVFAGNTNSLEEANDVKVNAVIDGYEGSFVVAYKEGRRITLKEAGATMFDNFNAAEEQRQVDAENALLDEKNAQENAQKTPEVEVPEEPKAFIVVVGKYKSDVPVEEFDAMMTIGTPKAKAQGGLNYFYYEVADINAGKEMVDKLKGLGFKESFLTYIQGGSIESQEKAAQEINK